MRDTYPRFTVAAVQAASVLFDRDKSIDKAIRLIEEAADKGASIIAFPEVFIAGHMGLWYKGRKLNPFDRVHEVFKEIYENGVRVPSPETDRLCNAAKKANAYVFIGINEIDPLFPATVYMSQLCISDKGEIVGVHRKMMPTVYEKFVYSPGDGSYLKVFRQPLRQGLLSNLRRTQPQLIQIRPHLHGSPDTRSGMAPLSLRHLQRYSEGSHELSAPPVCERGSALCFELLRH